MMIAVMGASGNTGTRISGALLERGQQVRALGRSESKLADLKRAGADVVTGDAADLPFLAKAFRGADAVYALLPPDPTSPDYRARQDAVGEAIAAAVRDGGVRHVVFLS
nr:NAD(P)H-binding protein [Acidobacteriota bacterium]